VNTATIGSASNSSTTTGILCGIGAGALWGLVFLAPELVRDFTPLQLAIGRYGAYGLISAALIAPRWKTLVSLLSRRDWLALAWLSFAGNIFYYILLSAAVQNAGVALTSLVIGFLPVVVTIVGSRDAGAVPLKVLLPSLAFCAAGAVCIGWQALGGPATGTDRNQLVGLICAIGALIAWSAYAVTNSRCLTRLDRVSVHDWNLLTGVVTGAQAVALVPVTLTFEPIQHTGAGWLHFAGVSIGVAIAASIVGNALWNRMSRLLPLTMVGQMILFETLFALLYGFLWEGRLPLPLEIAAAIFVAASVMSCIKAHHRRSSTAEIERANDTLEQQA
jgi:drug/metabolite transporter (DMT)-like permease